MSLTLLWYISFQAENYLPPSPLVTVQRRPHPAGEGPQLRVGAARADQHRLLAGSAERRHRQTDRRVTTEAEGQGVGRGGRQQQEVEALEGAVEGAAQMLGAAGSGQGRNRDLAHAGAGVLNRGGKDADRRGAAGPHPERVETLHEDADLQVAEASPRSSGRSHASFSARECRLQSVGATKLGRLGWPGTKRPPCRFRQPLTLPSQSSRATSVTPE